jgi:hypothetical protein
MIVYNYFKTLNTFPMLLVHFLLTIYSTLDIKKLSMDLDWC